jgi:tryptophanase
MDPSKSVNQDSDKIIKSDKSQRNPHASLPSRTLPHQSDRIHPPDLARGARRPLKEAGYNVFALKAEDIFIDMLTDSGTGAMSQEQWAAMMQGDESYAGARSYYRLAEAIDVEDIMGFRFFVPTHQGRAAENILIRGAGQARTIRSFEHALRHHRRQHPRARRRPTNLVIDEAFDPQNPHPFKGNMDIAKLRSFIELVGAANIPFGMVTVTNNAGGGQPLLDGKSLNRSPRPITSTASPSTSTPPVTLKMPISSNCARRATKRSRSSNLPRNVLLR